MSTAINSTTDSFTPTTATSSSGTSALANKTIFMQLLVAQLKNQNPLNPADGTTFVTQLAQFSSLEQLTSISSNVGTIKDNVIPQQTSSAGASDTSSGSSSSSDSTSNV